jgi:hypothetical protein
MLRSQVALLGSHISTPTTIVEIAKHEHEVHAVLHAHKSR